MSSSVIIRNPAILNGEPVFSRDACAVQVSHWLPGTRAKSEWVSWGLSRRDAGGRDCRTWGSQDQPCGSVETKLLLDECLPRKLKFLLSDSREGMRHAAPSESAW